MKEFHLFFAPHPPLKRLLVSSEERHPQIGLDAKASTTLSPRCKSPLRPPSLRSSGVATQMKAEALLAPTMPAFLRAAVLIERLSERSGGEREGHALLARGTAHLNHVGGHHMLAKSEAAACPTAVGAFVFLCDPIFAVVEHAICPLQFPSHSARRERLAT
jgi:hypothetical protein